MMKDMIFIVVKYNVKPECVDSWLPAVAEFTAATRAEPGNNWFEWYRDVEKENVFLLVESFQDGAGEAHVSAPHFQKGLEVMRPLLAATPEIVSQSVDATGWFEMGELKID